MSTRQSVGLLILSMAVLAPALCGQEERGEAMLRALVLSGQNNHDWRATTPRIVEVLEQSSRFAVEVAERPDRLDAAALESCDVIVSNWNAFPGGGEATAVTAWPAAARAALVDFVRGGKGLLSVHAGSSSFYDWPEYGALTIARWGPGRTGHGPRHVFDVRIERDDHPLTRGMRPFAIRDELWHGVPVQSGARVLARAFSAQERGGSGRWEPVVLVRPYGAGRSCTLLLGHDLTAMRHPAWVALLVRGAEWAATGQTASALPAHWPTSELAVAALEVPLERALAAIRSYSFGQDRRPLRIVAEQVQAAANDPDARRALAAIMGEMLAGDVSVGCQCFLCEQLATIGDAAQVPALSALLADPRVRFFARGALENIARPAEVPRAVQPEWVVRPGSDALEGLHQVVETATERETGAAALRDFLELQARATDRIDADRIELLRSMLHTAVSSEFYEAFIPALVAALVELELPENLALGARADSPDGLEPDHGGRDAPAAIDGDPATYWDEKDDQELYRLRVTLDEPRVLAALRITGHAQHSYAPRDFRILLDGRELCRIEGARYDSNRYLVGFEPSTGRVLELEISGYYGRSPAIRELELLGPTIATAPERFEWHEGDDFLELRHAGRVVWRFNHPLDGRKPHFHPVALPGGAPLTWSRPPDHTWHHALWFAWKFLNGVNFWEEDPRGRSAGETHLKGVATAAHIDGSGRIALELDYRLPGGTVLLDEERVVEISVPRADGRYHLDWTLRFNARGREVTLDRTPLPGEPGGKSWGGYAGLSVRFARELGRWQVVSDTGARDLAMHGQSARALDFSGELDGLPVGIAVLDHPENPRHPSPWFVIMDPTVPFAYLSPALLYREPLVLRATQSLTLRYRVIVHPGRWGPEELGTELERYAR